VKEPVLVVTRSDSFSNENVVRSVLDHFANAMGETGFSTSLILEDDGLVRRESQHDWPPKRFILSHSLCNNYTMPLQYVKCAPI
jgi:hypothetical protein